MKLLFCGSGWLPVVDAIRARLPAGMTIAAADRSRSLVPQLADVNVILPSNAGLTAAMLAAAPGAVLVQQPAVGVDGIDCAAAAARGIPVANAPVGSPGAVAEAALLLLLALARRWKAAARAFAEARIGVPGGRELLGRTLGLIGRGRSGGALARAAEALGMRVLAVRSTSTRDELLAMLAECDAVSVHCPLTERTRGLVDAGAFAAMKPGALLVNCARGAIVERAALEAALASGRLGGVGMDTYWVEPWEPADPLYAREDVLTLPHIAGSTEEAFGRIADIVVENARRIAGGEPVLHRIA